MLTSKLGRLLIVDDEAELMAALCEMLTEQGFETVGCTSGKEALAALREREFDLLLTDLMMPEMGGIELLQAGLSIDPNLVGIIMTGQGTIQTAVAAMKAGAFDYVLKPFKLNALLPVLSRGLELRQLRMENLQLRETLAIYELSKAIAFTLDPRTILNKVVEAAIQQCRADEASVMLPTREGKELYVAVVRGGQRGHLLGMRVPLERGIAGWVASFHEPLVLHGRVEDPRFAPLHPREDIRSAISMPMLVGGKLVGILNVNSTQPRRPFTLGQVKALSILVGTSASALEGARLYTQVQEAEEKYRSIFQNAVEGIYQMAPEGRCLTANPALARILGFGSPEELMACAADLDRYLCADPQRRAGFRGLLEMEGRVSGFESPARRKDGSAIWISQSARAVRDAGGKLLYYEGTVEDVTERKRLEEQLLRAQRLEMAGQIAGQVAHDFGNLLVPMVAYPELIKKLIPPDHPGVEMCDAMLRAANQMAAINEDLLTLGRRGRVEREPVDLNSLVRLAVDMVSDAPATLLVELDLAQDLFPVAAAPSQLLRVISNLVSNARDAMQDRGHLSLKTESVYVDGPFGRYNRVETGEYIRLSVADTGCGIPDEIKDRIFDAFFTTKRSDDRRGSGLGLSIVQAIVDDHQGYVDVESEVGRGTTFQVYLPVLREMVNEWPTVGIPGGTERILVVDDDRQQQEVLQGMLQMLGYQVEAAPSGEKALELLRERPVDLLILDMAMAPGIDGAETYRRALQIRPDQRAIILSGFAASERVQEALLLGVGAHLRKPANLATLAAAVRQELDRAR